MTKPQRKVPAEYNDRELPFLVEAGRIEGFDQSPNYKVLDKFKTLEEALKCVKDCMGYHFTDLLYVDAEGLVWDMLLLPKPAKTSPWKQG